MPILPNSNFASPNHSIAINIEMNHLPARQSSSNNHHHINRTSRNITIEIEPILSSSEPWYSPFMISPPRVQRLPLLQHTRQAITLPTMAYIAETQLWLRNPRTRQRALSTLYTASIVGGILGGGTSAPSENIDTSLLLELSNILTHAARGAFLTPLALAILIIGGRLALNCLPCFGAVIEELIDPTHPDSFDMRSGEIFEYISTQEIIMRNIRRHFVNQIKDHWQDMPISKKVFDQDECCPITLTPLFDADASRQLHQPSTLKNQAGVFEYKDLLLWFIKNPTNPMSREPLDPADLEKIVRTVQLDKASSTARGKQALQPNHETL